MLFVQTIFDLWEAEVFPNASDTELKKKLFECVFGAYVLQKKTYPFWQSGPSTQKNK